MRVLLVILILSTAVFLGACSKSQNNTPGGSQNGGPIIVNPLGSSFPNPYAS